MIPKARIEATPHNVGVIIDVCTKTFKLEPAIARLSQIVRGQTPDALRRNVDSIKEALMALDLVRSSMPSYRAADPSALLLDANGRPVNTAPPPGKVVRKS